MQFWRKYFILIIHFISTCIIVVYLGGCKTRTNVSSYMTEFEISSIKFWAVQTLSTNNDDVAVVVIEKDIGDDKMFMSIENDSDGNLTYNSPTIVNGKLKKKGLYIVKENQLVYIPATHKPGVIHGKGECSID